MTNPNDTTFNAQLVLNTAIRRPLRWIVPAAVVTALALGYAVVKSPKWESKQALVVRNEAIGQQYTAQGKFASVDDMQTAQETVLELVKSSTVVKAALLEVGPASGRPSKYWPTLSDIEDLQGRIEVQAPNGSEFGRTEVFYLVVADTNRDRSAALTAALCDALEDRLGHLRNEKAQSLVNELQATVALTRKSLDTATARLAEMEGQLGSDVAELRILNINSSGESTIRTSITNVRNELRAEQQAKLANEQLLELLRTSGDAESIIALPNQLLQSQPALLRLKDGLVDAQLRTSRALGMMSHEHPSVQAAIEEEKDVRRRLHSELATAVRGLTVELEMNNRRIASLSNQLGQSHQRMNEIAGMRAEYNNLTSNVEQRSAAWNKAQQELADAQASQAASQAASLLTRLDGPQAGANASGPSRSMIVAAGAFGGLLFGFGLVVLTASPIVPGDASVEAAVTQRIGETVGNFRVATPAGNVTLKDSLTYLGQVLTPTTSA